MKHHLIVLLALVSGSLCSQTPSAAGTSAGALAAARVFSPDEGSVRTMANGGQTRAILRGTLPTGIPVSIHESVQQTGASSNPPHTIQHAEFILVREGTLLFEHDGLAERAVAGSILYVAAGTLHTVRSVGDVPARYVVVAVSGDASK